jgi:hypothetical protein
MRRALASLRSRNAAIAAAVSLLRPARPDGTRRLLQPTFEGIAMRYARTTLAALLIATLGVPAAQAQTEKTREQVRAELADAMRSGSLAASGEIGLPQSELSPQRYARAAAAPGRTRDEVRAELAEATRSGNLVATGEVGTGLSADFRKRYPDFAVAAKSRAQVKAETAEAIRNGDMLANNDSGLKLNELYPQRYARQRGMYAAEAQPGSAVAGATMSREARQ